MEKTILTLLGVFAFAFIAASQENHGPATVPENTPHNQPREPTPQRDPY